MDEDSQLSRPVMLLGPANGLIDALAARMGGLGFAPVYCPNLDDAALAIEQAEEPIHCALLPSQLADRTLKRTLKSLRKVGGRRGLHLVAVGPEPDRAGRKLLRASGIGYALWEPIDAATLRFQLNRLTRTSPNDGVRRAQRVPTRLPARVSTGGRGRDATVYSLSESGAFLETPRAGMTGAQVEVELLLPDATVRLGATVAFANVPGNLQRPNLPLGMGVSFTAPSAVDRKTLIGYVKSQLAQLAV